MHLRCKIEPDLVFVRRFALHLQSRCEEVPYDREKKNGYIVEFETMVNGQAVDNYRLCLFQEAASFPVSAVR